MAPGILWLWLCLDGASSAAVFKEKYALKASLRRWEAADETERQQIRRDLGDIRDWNVSAVTDMSLLFANMFSMSPWMDGTPLP